MGNTIYASFNDPELAEKAAGALLDFGVRADDISVVQSHRRFPDSRPLNSDLPMDDAPPSVLDIPIYSTEPPMFSPIGSTLPMEAPATSLGTPPPGASLSSSASKGTHMEDDTDNLESHAKFGISTTTSADSEAGAVKGVAWGAGVGILAAIAALAIPGFGLIVGGGALATALAGVAGSAGAGAIAGAVTGYLKDQGVHEDVAEEYVGAVSAGGAIVAVTCPSGVVSEDDARSILNKYGAANINGYSTGGYLA